MNTCLRTVSEVCTGVKPETMISGVRSLVRVRVRVGVWR